MITKLRANFKLTNILSKALLVLAYTLACWKDSAGALTLLIGCAPISATFLCCLFSGGIVAVVAHYLPRLYLKISKIYTFDPSEFSFFATLAWTAYYLLFALFKLIYLVAPTFIVWGGVIFPVISVLLAGLAFYVVTSKLYLNDLTRPYYFATLAFLVIGLAVLAGGVL